MKVRRRLKGPGPAPAVLVIVGAAVLGAVFAWWARPCESSDPQTSEVPVADAARAYGFHSPSRFARQYSRLFGELPSATRGPG